MRLRDAERKAKRFVAEVYPSYAHWNFDICFEHGGDTREPRKAWSFGLTPDEEDPDYEPGRTLTGYVHTDGTIEGMY